MRRVIAAALLAAGCASPGMPPGGPEDRLPPELEGITPDSGALNVQPRWVVFKFDEVVSERPQGVQSLERLFLISPRDGEARVDWRRDAIAVRPRRGWKPNTVYSVTMLPGLMDLRSNVRKQGATALFSTGGSIPDTRVSGIVFDWVAGRPAPSAAIEIIARDSTIYVGSADSTGRFEIRNVPLGDYTVRAFMDANSNRALDPREAWDSTGITLTGTAAVELLAFAHDTIGPRINTVTVVDSLTLRVTFDKRILPGMDMSPSAFRLLTADSAVVPIVTAAFGKAADSTRQAAERARQDSARGRDTTARAADTARARPAEPRIPMPIRNAAAARRDTTPAPKPSRPSPEAEAVVTLGAPLVAGTTYRLRAIDIRGLLGNPRTSDRVFTLPKPKATAADSAAVITPGPDGPRTPSVSPDTVRRRPPSDSVPPVVRPPAGTGGSAF